LRGFALLSRRRTRQVHGGDIFTRNLAESAREYLSARISGLARCAADAKAEAFAAWFNLRILDRFSAKAE
jgi:hypothetical protein